MDLESQMLSIHEVPLTPAFIRTPAIAFSGEVDPIWMSKLQKILTTKFRNGTRMDQKAPLTIN